MELDNMDMDFKVILTIIGSVIAALQAIIVNYQRNKSKMDMKRLEIDQERQKRELNEEKIKSDFYFSAAKELEKLKEVHQEIVKENLALRRENIEAKLANVELQKENVELKTENQKLLLKLESFKTDMEKKLTTLQNDFDTYKKTHNNGV